MGIGHSSGFCIGHWILFCTVMDGGVASDKLPCSRSCLVCSSAAGLSIQSWYIFDAVYLLDSVMEREFAFRDAKAHCDLTSWEECELHQTLQPSAASYQTNNMHPCVFVAEKVQSRQWRSQVPFLFLFFISKFRSQVQSHRPSELPFDRT